MDPAPPLRTGPSFLVLEEHPALACLQAYLWMGLAGDPEDAAWPPGFEWCDLVPAPQDDPSTEVGLL